MRHERACPRELHREKLIRATRVHPQHALSDFPWIVELSTQQRARFCQGFIPEAVLDPQLPYPNGRTGLEDRAALFCRPWGEGPNLLVANRSSLRETGGISGFRLGAPQDTSGTTPY